MSTTMLVQGSYVDLIAKLKVRIRSSQIQAAVSVNRALVKLYWEIGSLILEKLRAEGWGAGTIKRISSDLKKTFPDLKGFSATNLKYMVQFAETYSNCEIGQQAVGQIPWGHNIALLQRLTNSQERIWYAQKTVSQGWSRSVLIHWIEANLYERDGKALNNFDITLPAPQSDLAAQTLKDPYCFDFLTLRETFDERELEEGLLEHIQNFLLELGAGFAFVGRQYPICVGETDYRIDLLFYHTKLRCYCVIELKTTEFKPEHAGKLNFYLSAVDDMMRHPDDQPTIGMLLCKTRDKVKVEYALRDLSKPIGVAGYEVELVQSLPEDFQGSLPTIQEIEKEFGA